MGRCKLVFSTDRTTIAGSVMKTNKRLRKLILEVVDNQIRDLTPPATKETFERLVREGHHPDDARRLIGFPQGRLWQHSTF